MSSTVEPLTDDVALAYLEHLGLDLRPGTVDVTTLRRLQRAHVERVPYETVDIVLGRPPGIDPLESARRILGGRGGYCYHLNGAFSALLAWLGVDVSRHLAGVHGGRVEEPPGPDGNHLGLIVRTPDGEVWLADVGLGDGPAEPLALAEGEHVQRGFRYRLGPSPFGDGIWRFEHDPGGGFAGFDVATQVATMERLPDDARVPVDAVELRDDGHRAAPRRIGARDPPGLRLHGALCRRRARPPR